MKPQSLSQACACPTDRGKSPEEGREKQEEEEERGRQKRASSARPGPCLPRIKLSGNALCKSIVQKQDQKGQAEQSISLPNKGPST